MVVPAVVAAAAEQVETYELTEQNVERVLDEVGTHGRSVGSTFGAAAKPPIVLDPRRCGLISWQTVATWSSLKLMVWW